MAGDRRERPPDLQGEESVLAPRGRPRGGRRDRRGVGGHTGRVQLAPVGRWRATQVGCNWHRSGVGGGPHRSGALGTDQVLGVLLGRGECLSPLARSASVYSVGEVY